MPDRPPVTRGGRVTVEPWSYDRVLVTVHHPDKNQLACVLSRELAIELVEQVNQVLARRYDVQG